ncbi:MAG: hypothetical protein WKF30_14540 [Pyrinomonadaceae bacterium]
MTIITDNMAGHVMKRGTWTPWWWGGLHVANGDTANKIGRHGRGAHKGTTFRSTSRPPSNHRPQNLIGR